MKKSNILQFCITGALFIAFIVYTILVKFVGVEAVGPLNSKVGFLSFNVWAHNLTGTNFVLYNITDILGILAIGAALGFGIVGLVQLVKRKSIKKVDVSILVLGGFYVAVILAYVIFEFVVINYRPVLIEGKLEASYPSSTTMLMLCVMPTAVMQLNRLVKKKALRIPAITLAVFLAVFSVVARIISGVHWITDIIGGVILSAALVMLYYSVVKLFDVKNKNTQSEKIEIDG